MTRLLCFSCFWLTGESRAAAAHIWMTSLFSYHSISIYIFILYIMTQIKSPFFKCPLLSNNITQCLRGLKKSNPWLLKYHITLEYYTYYTWNTIYTVYRSTQADNNLTHCDRYLIISPCLRPSELESLMLQGEPDVASVIFGPFSPVHCASNSLLFVSIFIMCFCVEDKQVSFSLREHEQAWK